MFYFTSMILAVEVGLGVFFAGIQQHGLTD
jgi:hypothetical protein